MFKDIKEVRNCGSKITKPPVSFVTVKGDSGGPVKKVKTTCEFTRTQVDFDSISEAKKQGRKSVQDQGAVMGTSATYVGYHSGKLYRLKI